jgi:hypothetical protein
MYGNMFVKICGMSLENKSGLEQLKVMNSFYLKVKALIFKRKVVVSLSDVF